MKKFKKISFKSFWYFFIVIMLCGTFITFISLFIQSSYNNENNEQTNENESTMNDFYYDLDIAELIINSDYGSLITYSTRENSYFFNKTKIENNFFELVNNVINNANLINDDINNYKKIAKYVISSSKKELIINLFIYNKFMNNKRYKSFFKLIIQ